jgi:hypothetical protein
MAKTKSKLIANRSAHAVALANDGVASRHSGATKVKKEAVEVDAPVPVAPALSRPVRPVRTVRRPVDGLVEPVVEPVVEEPVSVPAVAAPAPRPRATKPRASAPIGPALSDSTQTRMREMSERLQAVRQQLADLQNKKRPARAARRTP